MSDEMRGIGTQHIVTRDAPVLQATTIEPMSQGRLHEICARLASVEKHGLGGFGRYTAEGNTFINNAERDVRDLLREVERVRPYEDFLKAAAMRVQE